jgi:hypothetical protein
MQNAELSALVAQKEPAVVAAIDLATAVASWDLTADERGRPLLVLRVRDQLGAEGSAVFAPDELRNERHLASRLTALKGAVLQVGHWRGQLRVLFDNIRQWCQMLPGGAYVEEVPTILREEPSGEYEATRLVITSGGRTMQVVPVALWIVGADGQVDLIGIGGPFTLLHSRKDAGWSFLRETPPITTYPLTQELFLELAEACLNG